MLIQCGMEAPIKLEEISEGHVHIWCALPDQISDPSLLEAYRALMDKGEKRKCDRYLSASKRHECLVSRALVRTVLSRYQALSPKKWRFVSNAHGKPEICPEQNQAHLRFNLAHTQGLVACALTRSSDVGIDVENTSLHRDMRAVQRFFAPCEKEHLQTLQGPEKLRRFHEIWTLKEACAKANGKGLGIGLARFWFLIGKDNLPRVVFEPGEKERGQDWSFFLFYPTPAHVGAVAIAMPGGARAVFSIRLIVPLL